MFHTSPSFRVPLCCAGRAPSLWNQTAHSVSQPHRSSLLVRLRKMLQRSQIGTVMSLLFYWPTLEWCVMCHSKVSGTPIHQRMALTNGLSILQFNLSLLFDIMPPWSSVMLFLIYKWIIHNNSDNQNAGALPHLTYAATVVCRYCMPHESSMLVLSHEQEVPCRNCG